MKHLTSRELESLNPTAEVSFDSGVLIAWRNLRLAPCRPPLYARGGHLQTLLGFLRASPIFKEKTEEIFIQLNDGETLHGRVREGHSTLVIYLFHGLGGSLDSNYIQRTARIAHRLGATVVMGNHRGSGEGRALAQQPYHSGSSGDLSAFVAYGRKRWPEHRHLTIGFSLSANASLLLAAGHLASVLPDAAITVNAPIDLRACALALKAGLNRVYDLNFVRDMRDLVKDRKLEGQSILLKPLASMYDFDQAYTGRAAGFRDREDYYDSCSANRYSDQIRIPTFVMTAADDPFIPVRLYEEMPKSPKVILHIESTGGHLGYLSRELPPEFKKIYGERWLDYALHQLIEPLLRLKTSESKSTAD